MNMRNNIMGSEEPGYQVLPRSVLRKHNIDDDKTWTQKFIGTQKCNSEAVAKTNRNHVTKDPDSSTKDDSSTNIQRATHPTTVGDKGSTERCDSLGKQRGSNSNVVEPRSY